MPLLMLVKTQASTYRGGTSYEKLGGRKISGKAPKKICSLPPLIGGTCLFCHPVEAMHATTIMSLNSEGYRPTILTSNLT